MDRYKQMRKITVCAIVAILSGILAFPCILVGFWSISDNNPLTESEYIYDVMNSSDQEIQQIITMMSTELWIIGAIAAVACVVALFIGVKAYRYMKIHELDAANKALAEYQEMCRRASVNTKCDIYIPNEIDNDEDDDDDNVHIADMW